MKIALISDIHGNLEALEAVLADCEGRKVDKVHCLGDVVGYGSDPGPCLELIQAHCDIRLMGNHEHAVLGQLSTDLLNPIAKSSMAWTKDQLSDKHLTTMNDFLMDATFENLYFVHASPFEPDKWHYILTTSEAERAFQHLPKQIGFAGHSHLPLIFSKGPAGPMHMYVGHDFHPFEENQYLVNVGSVGQPRDNDPRACYVIFDSSEQELTYYRVEYDMQLTQSKMSRANLPKMLIDRLLVGR